MKNTKKILLILIVSTIIASGLTGCGLFPKKTTYLYKGKWIETIPNERQRGQTYAIFSDSTHATPIASVMTRNKDKTYIVYLFYKNSPTIEVHKKNDSTWTMNYYPSKVKFFDEKYVEKANSMINLIVSLKNDKRFSD